jgi:RimJ/RimL family protein N-acetyltransferase
MFIRSERLFLRPAWPEDWEAIYAGIADERVVKNLARAPWPYLPEHAQAFAAREPDRRFPTFLVTLPGTGVIGGAGIHPDDRGITEIGYWIARPYWGRGYAPEAARALLSIARTLGHCRIGAGHFVDNPASGRVLRKAGFRPTGAVEKRFSLARGCEVDSVEYAIELCRPCGSDDDDEGATMFKRAA